MNEATFRLRINYGKQGRLCHLSHLELVRAMERVIRRSQVPFALSQGFNVHMKHAFGPALPVGTAGCHELLDVLLRQYVPLPDVLQAFKAATIPDLPINEVRYCALKAPSLQVSHTISHYEIYLSAPDTVTVTQLENAFAAVLAIGSLTTTRKKKTKEIDLTAHVLQPPYVILEKTEGQASFHSHHFKIIMHLRANENGSLRPELFLKAAFVHVNDAQIMSITRTELNEEAS